MLGTSFLRFLRNTCGGTSTVFALSAIPIGIASGAALDFSRTTRVTARLQAALDSAVLSGVQLAVPSRDAYAQGVYAAQARNLDGESGTPVFTSNTDGSYAGAVTVTLPTTMMKLIGRDNVVLNLRAKASKKFDDQSCILALSGNMLTSADTITLNGGPNLNLSGCALRSNASMECNGHSGNASASIAVGTAPGCANPQEHSPSVPDTHAPLASNINKRCSTTANSITWNVGTLPSSPNLITYVNANGQTEYHLCGTVTVKGSGTLFGSTTSDSIIVIENGSLTLAKDADATLLRTTLILTGSASNKSHQIVFPQGNGHSAYLRISPAQDSANPWRGVAIYQDPAITENVNLTWGPGANIFADGVLYFPNSSVTMSGNMGSKGSNCTKLIVHDFTSNGAVALSQSITDCATLGMSQYSQNSVLQY